MVIIYLVIVKRRHLFFNSPSSDFYIVDPAIFTVHMGSDAWEEEEGI